MEEENHTSCTVIVDFFADMISTIQIALNSKLASMVFIPFSLDVFYADHNMTSLSTVTPAEVYKLTSAMTAKS